MGAPTKKQPQYVVVFLRHKGENVVRYYFFSNKATQRVLVFPFSKRLWENFYLLINIVLT